MVDVDRVEIRDERFFVTFLGHLYIFYAAGPFLLYALPTKYVIVVQSEIRDI